MKDLTIGKEWKVIVVFALPILLGNVFQQVNTIIDSIVVGKYIGKDALAAVGSTFPVIFMMVALIIGISIGGTVVIAQNFGAKKLDQVKKASDTLMIFMFVATFIMSVVGIVFSKAIFRGLNLPAELIPMATLYIRWYFVGMIFIAIVQAIGAVLRGLGDSKTPMYIMITMTLINIALDFVFIAWMGMGVAGAALACVIGAFLAAVLGVAYVIKKQPLMEMNPFKMRFDTTIFKQCLNIGLPTGLQQSFVAMGMMAILAIVNGFGTDTVAAFTAAGRIDMFAALPAMNFAAALSSFVGQNLGANRSDRVTKGLLVTWIMTSIISILITIVAHFFGPELMSMFTKDANVIAIGARYLVIVCTFYILFSSMFTLTGVFRGAGDTLIPMFITLFSLWLVRVPLSYFLSKSMGTDGIWWGIPVAWLVGAIASYYYYKTGRWKKKIVVKPANYEES